MLLHWQHTADWPETTKRWQDGILEAQQRKIVRTHGASVHGLPASAPDAGHQVARRGIDPHQPQWGAHGRADLRGHQPPRQRERSGRSYPPLKNEGLGVIGMKLCGGGQFQNSHDDRVKAMRFAFQNAGVDSATIGFKSTQEIDEAISNMNLALA